jgi:hypothetical protein
VHHGFQFVHKRTIPPAALHFFPYDGKGFFCRQSVAVRTIRGKRVINILSFAIILCACDFNYIRRCDSQPICDTNRACFSSGDFSLAAFSELFGPGQVCYWKTWLLAVLKRKHPRPQIAVVDKLFWVLTRRVWSGWQQALTVVTPDTVVRWHREGFALYWRAISWPTVSEGFSACVAPTVSVTLVAIVLKPGADTSTS